MRKPASLFDSFAFSPEVLALLQASFDAAWALHASDFAFDAAGREAGRRELAQAIVTRYMIGDDDRESLKHHGLVALLRFRNAQLH